jgi:hypothetical protein
MKKHIMSLPFARKAAVCFCWSLFLAIPAAVFAQTDDYAAFGTEYPVVGSLPGDQMFPDAAVTPAGGFIVWQDNITDGDGWGVSAMRLDSSLSGSGSSFRVNQQGAGDQNHARVALLKNGGAVFVWQGGQPGYQRVYARFLTASNTWLTGDVPVNTFTNNFQISPSVTILTNGNVVITWASFDEVSSNSLQDVYARIFSPTGQPVTGEFLVNQFTSFNQRTPAVAALANGGFVVAWVSEQERSTAPNWGTNSTYYGSASAPRPSVDVYARLYNANGAAPGNEFLVNTDSNPAADPVAAVVADSSFLIAWDANDMANPTNGWDIYARPFSAAGAGGTTTRVNTHTYGDQFGPRLSVLGGDYMIVWTSLGQDGSREGVFGQLVHEDGSLVSGEFRVNTTTFGQQMQPAVASDGAEQFLVAWAGFTFGPNSFDLFAQRYENAGAVLPPMAAPFVYAPFVVVSNKYQPQLAVSWAFVSGVSVSNYEVYVNGATTPLAVVPGTTNAWTMTAANGLGKSSTNFFAVDYVTTDGRRSPLSPAAAGATWSGLNWSGIPYEWMEQYYGDDLGQWPSANAPLAPGGPTLSDVFLSGGNPLDSSTWLKTALVGSPQGFFLTWNPQPGFTYQVQASTNLAAWSDLGAPRFATGGSDSIFVGKGAPSYYRLQLLRQ